MKGGKQPQGYTIVESLIFLAVSGMLVVIGISLMSGQQNRTEFSQSVRDFQQQIDDVINDISTGYYSNPGGAAGAFSCTRSATLPITPVLNTLTKNPIGSNSECIYLGKVLQFAPTGDSSSITTVTVVGLRKNSSGKSVASIAEANPVLMAQPTTSIANWPNITEKLKLSGGLTIKKVYFNDPQVAVGSVAILSNLSASSFSTLSADSKSADVVPISSTAINTSTPSQVEVVNTNLISSIANKNPQSGVGVCVDSGGTNQYAILTIGGNNRTANTKLTIYSGRCP